jgi:hypothetical protein
MPLGLPYSTPLYLPRQIIVLSCTNRPTLDIIFIMTSIASPRPSIASIATLPPSSPGTSSARSSLNLDRTSSTTTTGTLPRRNRAALRDYYNLKEPSTSSTTTLDALDPSSIPDISSSTSSHPLLAPLSSPSFSSATYISALLSTSTLSELLGVERALVGDIRGLDGERKALVYDNYSKLIAATDTVGRMSGEMQGMEKEMRVVREGMEGVVGVVGKVVEAGKGTGNGNGSSGMKEDAGTEGVADEHKTGGQDRKDAVQTVKYVMDTPTRLARLVGEGKQDDAEADWAEVNQLLQKWTGVKGVKEIREKSIAALNP